jgi:hypothetical protein
MPRCSRVLLRPLLLLCILCIWSFTCDTCWNLTYKVRALLELEEYLSSKHQAIQQSARRRSGS